MEVAGLAFELGVCGDACGILCGWHIFLEACCCSGLDQQNQPSKKGLYQPLFIVLIT